MEILFIQLSDDAYISILKKMTLMTGFVVQGHICADIKHKKTQW